MRISKSILDSCKKGVELFSINVDEFIEAASKSKSFNECRTSIDNILLKYKQKYLELSLKHHPDRGGNIEEFKQFQECWNALKSDDHVYYLIHCVQQINKQQMMHMINMHFIQYHNSTATTSTTTSYGFNGPTIRIVF